MEPVINTIITIGVGLFAGLLAWIFKDSRNALWKELISIRSEAKENDKEQNRKIEKLDSELRLLENEKFNAILIELGKITEVVGMMQKDISELKEYKNQSQNQSHKQ